MHAHIYADDAGFYGTGAINFSALIEGIKGYVPGRNLHMLWQQLSFTLSFNDATYVPYHIFQSFIFTLNGFLLACNLLKFKLNIPITLIATLFFIYQPLSSEVLFWSSALPMHLFSTTFILILVSLIHESLKKPDFRSLYFLLIFIGALAIYTYDQATTASFALIAIFSLIHLYLFKLKFFRYILLIFFSFSIMFFHYSYLILQIRPSSSGPVVRDGLLTRIFGSASSIFLYPLYTFTWIILIITIIAITFYLKSNIQNTQVNLYMPWSHLFIGIFSFFLLVAAFLPAWAWWVSPRHHYLPTVFLTVFLAVCTQIIFNIFKEYPFTSIFIYSSLSVVLVFFFSSFLDYSNFWNERNDLRSNTYISISKLIQGENLPDATCITFVDFDSASSSPFYSEVPTRAMGIYTNNLSTIQASCTNYAYGMIEKDDSNNCALVTDNQLRVEPEVFIDFPLDSSGERIWKEPRIIRKCE